MSERYTRADLALPPQWVVTPADEAALVKGRFIVCVLVALPETDSVAVYSQGDLIGVRADRNAARVLAEDLAARWFPGDPKPTVPMPLQTAPKSTAKPGSGNPYAAPIK